MYEKTRRSLSFRVPTYIIIQFFLVCLRFILFGFLFRSLYGIYIGAQHIIMVPTYNCCIRTTIRTSDGADVVFTDTWILWYIGTVCLVHDMKRKNLAPPIGHQLERLYIIIILHDRWLYSTIERTNSPQFSDIILCFNTYIIILLLSYGKTIYLFSFLYAYLQTTDIIVIL